MPKLSKTVDDFGFLLYCVIKKMDTLSHIKYQKDEGRRKCTNTGEMFFVSIEF